MEARMQMVCLLLWTGERCQLELIIPRVIFKFGACLSCNAANSFVRSWGKKIYILICI